MRIWLVRLATASLAAVFVALGPVFGLVYGAGPALMVGETVFLSPLEFILVSLGTRTFFVQLFTSAAFIVVATALLGRSFCGWICPVGVPLEFLHFNFLRKRKGSVRRGSSTERYIILITVLLAALLFNFSAPYLFSPPGAVYRLLIGFSLQWTVGADLLLLGVFLGLDILSHRFGRTWCRSLCPLGTTISSLSLINLFKPKVEESRCVDIDGSCLKCEAACPMAINLKTASRWSMMSCSKCFRCVESCAAKAVEIELVSSRTHLV